MTGVDEYTELFHDDLLLHRGWYCEDHPDLRWGGACCESPVTPCEFGSCHCGGAGVALGEPLGSPGLLVQTKRTPAPVPDPGSGPLVRGPRVDLNLGPSPAP
jgi:hypothetical protein